MNEQGNQAASRCTSDEAMIERLAAAYDACFATRGKNKGKFRKAPPKWGTDVNVMWNAMTLEFNPYRAGIASMIMNNHRDHEFYTLCGEFAKIAYEQASA